MREWLRASAFHRTATNTLSMTGEEHFGVNHENRMTIISIRPCFQHCVVKVDRIVNLRPNFENI